MWSEPYGGGDTNFYKCAVIERHEFNELVKWYGEAFVEEFLRLFPEEKEHILKSRWSFLSFFIKVFRNFVDILLETLGVIVIFVYTEKYRNRWLHIGNASTLYDYLEVEGILDELYDELRKHV